MKKSIVQKIADHPFFRGVDADLLNRLFDSGGMFARTYAAGEVIRSPEDAVPTVGILLSGKATVTTKDPARSVLLRYLGAGDPFGIANLFCNEPFVSWIRASGSCSCFFMTEETVRVLLQESPPFRENYIAFLGGRIRFLNRKIGYLTAGSAERRLALYLLSFGSQTVRLSLSVSALSDLLNLGRASLYRAFDRLEADGHLCRDGRTVRLLSDSETLLQSYL